jgi:Fe-S cluster assembly protein SufD
MSVAERYLAQYRAFSGNGAAIAPAWLQQIREAAIARFTAVGFPTTKQEEWRFTSVQSIAETVFVHSNALWTTGGAPPPGVTVTTLREATRTHRDLLQAHLGRHASIDRNPFTALATAFLDDGIFLFVPPRTVIEQPIQLTCRLPSAGGNPIAHPRVLIIVGDQARVTVVESHESGAEGRGGESVSLSNAVTELVLGEGARLDYVRVQRERESAYHVATTQSMQGRDSVLHSTTVALGAALSRHDIGAVLGGTGGSLVLNGLSLLHGRQHVDHHTTIDHAQPHCESHELFNGVFEARSRGVFNGRIIVRPGAQRTDSKQTNNNLLLSEDARADSQPQLEIYADDVKCTHGATLGPLDPTALFYLRSRGVGEAEARGLLTYGFGVDILSRIGVPDVREALDRIVRARLGVGEWRSAAA